MQEKSKNFFLFLPPTLCRAGWGGSFFAEGKLCEMWGGVVKNEGVGVRIV